MGTVLLEGHDLVEAVRARTRADLPLPGGGATGDRFEALADIAAVDLCLAKLVEPHHDATAILAELGSPPPGTDDLWAVWAAEPPHARVRARLTAGSWRLSGTKAFCSGAAIVTHALLTADSDEGPRLFAVDIAGGLLTGRVELAPPDWVGPGMARAGTRTIVVRDLDAMAVGGPGEYVGRPGFWQGAVGVAACWLGGARAVAERLERAGRGRELDDHSAAHLGAVTAGLDAATAQLHATAQHFDADPSDAKGLGHRVAESCRATAVAAAETSLVRLARAMGPAPLAFDAVHAQRVSDLEVFIRQHHGERDLARLGRLVVGRRDLS